MRIRSVAAFLATVLFGTFAFAAPASAAPADRWGFAAVWNPTVPPGTTLDTSRQWGSWKAAAPALWATGGKLATGRFQVVFPNVGTGSRGNAHVTAVGTGGHYCEIVRWFQLLSDEVVEVQCHRPGGLPADTPFTVQWSFSTTPALPVSSVYATLQATATGFVAQAFTSVPLGTVSVGPAGGAGQYTVRFGGAAVAGVQSGNLQVTAIQPNAQPRRCKVGTWSIVGTDVQLLVFCFNQAGTLTNSDFTVSYHRQRSVYGGLNPPRYFGYVWSAGSFGQTNYNNVLGFGANSVSAIAPPGRYGVHYPAIGIRETHSHVTAYGVGSHYCGLAGPWSLVGTNADLDVMCFTNTGALAPHQFFSSFTSRH